MSRLSSGLDGPSRWPRAEPRSSTAARALLTEKAVTDVSLREFSDRVGLAKSNVLRYFDSREAIFLEVLDVECRSWLLGSRHGTRQTEPGKPRYADEIRVATTIAASLSHEALL